MLDKKISVDGPEKMIDQKFGDDKGEQKHQIRGVEKTDRQKRGRPQKLENQKSAEQSCYPLPLRILESGNQRQPLAEQKI